MDRSVLVPELQWILQTVPFHLGLHRAAAGVAGNGAQPNVRGPNSIGPWNYTSYDHAIYNQGAEAAPRWSQKIPRISVIDDSWE